MAFRAFKPRFTQVNTVLIDEVGILNFIQLLPYLQEHLSEALDRELLIPLDDLHSLLEHLRILTLFSGEVKEYVKVIVQNSATIDTIFLKLFPINRIKNEH